MATGSETQSSSFSGEAFEKLRVNSKSALSGFAPSKRFLRRANKPQKCFVSGETESVANTSAFVGPVAFNFGSDRNHQLALTH